MAVVGFPFPDETIRIRHFFQKLFLSEISLHFVGVAIFLQFHVLFLLCQLVLRHQKLRISWFQREQRFLPEPNVWLIEALVFLLAHLEQKRKKNEGFDNYLTWLHNYMHERINY